jgi:S-formylglutathione hydrolase FrmB
MRRLGGNGSFCISDKSPEDPCTYFSKYKEINSFSGVVYPRDIWGIGEQFFDQIAQISR